MAGRARPRRGLSLGGTIGQLLALDWPGRLLTLTLMCTAALDVDFAGNVGRALRGSRAATGSRCPTGTSSSCWRRGPSPWRLARRRSGGEGDPRHYATLVDRVASAAEGLQRYGTLAVSGPDGPQFLMPVENDGGLDDRRRAVGLPPLADDLASAPGQLPYRHLRRSASFAWPPGRGGR